MEPRTGRTWTILVVAAAAIGLGVALYLTRLHLELLYGSGVGSSLCDFSEGINCSAVNASTASEIFGIPQSLLAIPAYVMALLLGVSAGVRRDERYALALAGVGLLAVLYSARLAWISATVIGAW
nr:Vitamin K epoxide reductase family [uncultured bacterium]